MPPLKRGVILRKMISFATRECSKICEHNMKSFSCTKMLWWILRHFPLNHPFMRPFEVRRRIGGWGRGSENYDYPLMGTNQFFRSRPAALLNVVYSWIDLSSWSSALLHAMKWRILYFPSSQYFGLSSQFQRRLKFENGAFSIISRVMKSSI